MCTYAISTNISCASPYGTNAMVTNHAGKIEDIVLFSGGNVPGQGSAPPEGQSHVFMITNLCPSVYPNLSWCSQTANKNNQYGYAEHFDLENGVRQITNGLGWNNPEVTWEWTSCDNGHRNDGRTPSTNNFHSCQCG